MLELHKKKNSLPPSAEREKVEREIAVTDEKIDDLDKNHIDEYRSLKHGFRVKSGGFGLSAGIEHQYGVPPPENEMQLLGHSDYGATFFNLEPIGNEKQNRSLISHRISLNWKVEKVSLLIQLISMSIKNIVSALKIVNGSNPATNKFVRPTEDDDFKKPWMYSPGVTVCSLDLVIDESEVILTTRKELLDRLKELKRNKD